MTKKKKETVFCITSLILLAAFYLFIVIGFIKLDLNTSSHTFSIRYIKAYVVPRIHIYIADYFTFIPFFMTCLFYIKRKKMWFYISGIFTAILLIVCLKYNLPLFPRNVESYQVIWQADVLEYFFPIINGGMLLFLLFFPFLHDVLQKYCKGKKALIIVSLVMAISITLESAVNSLVIGSSMYVWEIVLFIIIAMIKVGILVCICKLIINKKECEPTYKKWNYWFALKGLIPFAIIFCIVLFKVNIENYGIRIFEREKIDGYLFLGSVEAFIEQYETPYQEKRRYLDIEQISENKLENKDTVIRWTYSEEDNTFYITTCERKLEAFCYLEPYSEEECLSSNGHCYELIEYMRIGQKGEPNDYRAVLSSEIYEGKVFHYRAKSESNYPPDLYWPYTVYGNQWRRDVEAYDILIEGKEIPAYYLGMVKNCGIIKVEPYTHYRGENPLIWKDSNISMLWPERQY